MRFQNLCEEDRDSGSSDEITTELSKYPSTFDKYLDALRCYIAQLMSEMIV